VPRISGQRLTTDTDTDIDTGTDTDTGSDTDTDTDAGSDTDLQDFVGALLQDAQVLHHVALTHPFLAQQDAHRRRAAPCLLKHVADALLQPETHAHHSHSVARCMVKQLVHCTLTAQI